MKKLFTTLSILLLATASYAQTYTVERVIDKDVIESTNDSSQAVYKWNHDGYIPSEGFRKAKREAIRRAKVWYFETFLPSKGISEEEITKLKKKMSFFAIPTADGWAIVVGELGEFGVLRFEEGEEPTDIYWTE